MESDSVWASSGFIERDKNINILIDTLITLSRGDNMVRPVQIINIESQGHAGPC